MTWAPPPQPPDRTLLVDQVTAGFLAPHGAGTRRTYEASIHAWIGWCEREHVDPLAPPVGECRRYLDHWIARSTSNGTVRLRCKTVAAFIDHAIDHAGVPGPNPWRDIRVPMPPNESTTRALNADQHTTLLAYSATRAGANVDALVRLLAVLGLRVSEAIGFNLAQLRAEDDRWVYRYRAKGTKDRSIEVDDQTVTAIHAASGGATTGLLFPGRSGTAPVDRDTAANWLAGVCTAAGVPVVTPHGLRHSAITRVWETTGDPAIAQEFAGHADVSTTVRYDRRSGKQGDGLAAVLRATTSPNSPATRQS